MMQWRFKMLDWTQAHREIVPEHVRLEHFRGEFFSSG